VRTISRTTLEYRALMAEIAGAIAIVVSVIYLGVQIRANTKVLRSQAYYNALSLAQRPYEMAIADQGLADLIETSYASPEKLTQQQWVRCANIYSCNSIPGNICTIKTSMAPFPGNFGSAPTPTSKELIKTKRGLKRFWSEYQHAFDDPFRSYVTNEFAKKTSLETPNGRTSASNKN
jgi:hypothetical protein